MSLIFDSIDLILHLIVKSIIILIALIFCVYYGFVLIRKLFFNGVIKTDGKAVLITGCDSGFGNLLALRLNKLGFKVYATVLNTSSSGAQELQTNAVTADKMIVWKMDVTNDGDVKQVYENVKKDLENSGDVLWAVVNNAGICQTGLLESGTLEAYQTTIDVNVFGSVRVTKTFLPLIRASKGRITNMISFMGRFSWKYLGIYCMSKHSMVAFNDALRREVRKFGVKVSSIEPGVFQTPIMSKDNFIKSFEQLWDQSSEEFKMAYDLQYEKRILEDSINLYPVEYNLDLVINDMIDSITNVWPKIVYRPMNLFSKIGLFLIMYLPEALTDWIAIRMNDFLGIPIR